MVNILEFIKNENFLTKSSFPDGDTFLSMNTEIKETIQEWEGKPKTRYEFIDGKNSYYGGVKVLEGIQIAKNKADLEGIKLKEFRVTKSGTGIKTNYSVVGIKE